MGLRNHKGSLAHSSYVKEKLLPRASRAGTNSDHHHNPSAKPRSIAASVCGRRAARMVVRSATLEEGLGAEVEETSEECDERRSALLARLREIEAPAALEKSADPAKPETHRESSLSRVGIVRAGDFLLKEMAWMAADFETERKRHAALRKKRCRGVLQYFKNLEGCVV